MIRDNYTSLNGEWIMNNNAVCVPCCQQEKRLSYVKAFKYQKRNDRTILHFDAVDQLCSVILNDVYLGEHQGGYLPFEFDVSDIISDNNKLYVEVIDELDMNYPYGKQSLKPQGMWYTAVSGIWGNVWLEDVPKDYIKSIRIKTDLKGADLLIFTNKGSYQERISIDKPRLWQLDDPYLYHKKITYQDDAVEIYFGLREIKIIDKQIYLNNKKIFLNGVLDQGYWPKGIFLPDEDNAYEKDINNMKELGFNLLRKHIKIEPERFYYECDRKGILLMQDMVQNGKYSFIKDTVLPTIGINRKDQVKQLDERMIFFIKHSIDTINHLYNHPSIIAWTIFNEGWGQFNSDEIYEMFKKEDDSRLIDATSGWFKQNKSDFDSQHVYFRLKNLKVKDKPLIVSECGGYIYEIDNKAGWGYGKCYSKEELTDKIIELYEKMIIPKINKGLCACIYTQLSDVENELNGLYTYDRKICKVNKQRLRDFFENKINSII